MVSIGKQLGKRQQLQSPIVSAAKRRSFFLPLLVLCLFCLAAIVQQENRRTGDTTKREIPVEREDHRIKLYTPYNSTSNSNVTTKEGIPVEKEDHRIKVYAPYNTTPNNVAICVIVYNETLYLDEWIDFHVALGFSPIYIYDNSLEFELKTVPFSGNHSWYQTREDIWDHVELIHFPKSPVQLAAYNQCIKKDAIDSTFVALIDVDEFLVLKTYDNVIDFMEHHCDFRCGQLSINWQSMGISNQKQYNPVPVTKRNVHFSESMRMAMHATIKVIVRPLLVADPMFWRHSVMLKKGKRWVDTNYKTHSHPFGDYRRQQNQDKPLDRAVLYHYPFKSEEEFHYKTCVKGTSLHARGETPMCNNPKYYRIYNGTEFDDTAWKQLTRMVPKYRVYGEAVNITL